MADPRVQVQGIGGPKLQPSESPSSYPVDPFVRPNEGANRLGQLARALGDLAPELSRYANMQREDDTVRGREAAAGIFEDIKKTGQQIKTGEIAPHESKWYRAAATEQLGRLAAGQYASDLDAAMRAPDNALSTSTDPKDFDQFASQFREQWLKDNAGGSSDPQFLAGFNNGSVGQELDLRNRFNAEAGKRLELQKIGATYQEHVQAITEGLTGEHPLSMEQIADAIKIRNAREYLLNPKSGKQLQAATIQAVVDTAKLYRDESILKLLDYIPGGAIGSTIGKTGEGIQAVIEARREIASETQQRYNLASAESREAKRQADSDRDAVYSAMFDTLAKAGDGAGAVDLAPFVKQMNDLDPQSVVKLQRAAEAFVGHTSDRDDRDVYRGLELRAIQGDLKVSDIADSLASRDITPETAQKLANTLKRGKSGSLKSLLSNPSLSEYRGRLKGLFGDVYGGDPGIEIRMRSERAQEDLDVMFTEMAASPDGETILADPDRLGKWMHGAVDAAFRQNATAPLIQKWDAIPRTPGQMAGPQPIKWEQGPVVDAPTYQGIAHQFSELTSNPRTRTRFDPALEEVLTRNGIPLTVGGVRTFLERQREFVNLNDLR